MSVENSVFLNKNNLPTPQVWQEKITEFGFEMELDTDFDMLEFSGFLPCNYKGKPAGFEYYAEEVDLDEFVEEEYISEEDRKLLGDNNLMITLVTHSDFRELATSFIGATVLAKITNGFYAECNEPPFLNGDLALEKIRNELPSIEKEFTDN